MVDESIIGALLVAIGALSAALKLSSNRKRSTASRYYRRAEAMWITDLQTIRRQLDEIEAKLDHLLKLEEPPWKS